MSTKGPETGSELREYLSTWASTIRRQKHPVSTKGHPLNQKLLSPRRRQMLSQVKALTVPFVGKLSAPMPTKFLQVRGTFLASVSTIAEPEQREPAPATPTLKETS